MDWLFGQYVCSKINISACTLSQLLSPTDALIYLDGFHKLVGGGNKWSNRLIPILSQSKKVGVVFVVGVVVCAIVVVVW